MLRITALMMALLLSAGAALADKDADGKKIDLDKVVREIKVAPAKLGAGGGRPTAPVIIKSADELAAAFGDETERNAIAKQVDFNADQLVLFRWAGSGQDTITHAAQVKEGLEVTFQYRPGLTRDLRTHARLFAVAKNATVKMAGGK